MHVSPFSAPSNMSIFERTTKKLVKEIGDKKLRPVKCLERATKIRRFSLIRRKKARSLFWQLPDDPLDVSLMHILEPGSSVPGIVSHGHRRQQLQNKSAGRWVQQARHAETLTQGPHHSLGLGQYPCYPAPGWVQMSSFTLKLLADELAFRLRDSVEWESWGELGLLFVSRPFPSCSSRNYWLNLRHLVRFQMPL